MISLRTAFHPWRKFAWGRTQRWVQKSFPSVPTISTAELANWLAQEQVAPIVIDVRTAEEYAVSHLLQAHHARSLEAVEQIIADQGRTISQTAPIVLYCSVGYRSARLGESLQAAGYPVVNLTGSIFQWANEGRLLVSADEQQTRQVHPYNWRWQLLLLPID